MLQTQLDMPLWNVITDCLQLYEQIEYLNVVVFLLCDLDFAEEHSSQEDVSRLPQV